VDATSYDARRDLGWQRLFARMAALLLILLLVGVLVRSALDVIARAETVSLELAEQNLRNLVWLKAQRTVAAQGVAGLPALAGQDPRPWADVFGVAGSGGATTLQTEMDRRWSFDSTSGELAYRSSWLEEGERRWRVELIVEGAEGPTPGLARGLQLQQTRGR